MLVVCDNRSCMRNIRSEINYSLRNRSIVVSLTNPDNFQDGDTIVLITLGRM
jgi:hypothetical protein